MRIKNGFTLIELMVVIAVIAILTMYAVPAFKVSMVNNRLISETTNLTSMLNLARTESLRRNDYVSMCPSSNGTSCNGTDYSVGSVVFVDSTNTGLLSSSQVIRVFNRFPSSQDKGKSNNKITFSPVGAVNYGNILICTPNYNSYSIVVGSDGSIQKNKNTGDGGC